jgi:hypothetical protein
MSAGSLQAHSHVQRFADGGHGARGDRQVLADGGGLFRGRVLEQV